MQAAKTERKLIKSAHLMDLAILDYVEGKHDYEFHRNQVHPQARGAIHDTATQVHAKAFTEARTFALELMNSQLRLCWDTNITVNFYDSGFGQYDETVVSERYRVNVRGGADSIVTVSTSNDLKPSFGVDARTVIGQLYSITAEQSDLNYRNRAGDIAMNFSFVRNQIKNYIVANATAACFDVLVDVENHLLVAAHYATSGGKYLSTVFKVRLHA